MVNTWPTSNPGFPSHSPTITSIERQAFEKFNILLDRSLDGIAARVSELQQRHPGAYDQCLDLLAQAFERDASDVKGALGDYMKTLVNAYRTAPPVLESLSRGEYRELKFDKISPRSLLSCKVKLDESGEYRITLTFDAPPSPPDQKREVLSYDVQSRSGHFFLKTVPWLSSGSTWESLGALDEAAPFIPHSELAQLARPLAVERAYLLAFSDFVSFQPNPGGERPIQYRTYHFVELPGGDLEAKLAGALQVLRCEDPRSSSAVRESLPEGYRHGLSSCVGLQAVSGNQNPPAEELFRLVKSGGAGEWTVLQSKNHPTFNDKNAYVFVRRRTEQVISPEAPTVLIPVDALPFPKAVTGAICVAKRGGFEPVGIFGTVLADTTASPPFDPAAWELREADQLEDHSER
jgi:hypothetical protein